MGAKCFFYLVARGWENFKFGGGLLYWRDLISSLEKWGARPFPFINPQMTNHVNLRIVGGKISCFMCVRYLLLLLLGNFLFENFLSVQVSNKTLKKVFTVICLVITL